MNKKNSEDIAKKFWVEWLDSDELERIKMLQKTMLVKELSTSMLIKMKGSKLNKKFALDFSSRIFNDYLQDLEFALMSKMHKL